MSERYPLSWPVGVPRTPLPSRSAFDRERSLIIARTSLADELRRLGAGEITLSTNIELRQDGLPYSNRRQPEDKGAAVYFKLKGKDYCFPCDRWDRVEDNVYAIAKHIEAMRGQQRWGVGSVEQQFRGYQALPAPEHQKAWWEVFGCSADTPINVVKDTFKRLAFAHHPDSATGNTEMMALINSAYDQFKKERGLS